MTRPALLSLALLLPACPKHEAVVALSEPTADCFSEVAAALSADEMEGRGIGTDGLEKAAVYLEGSMRGMGLSGAGFEYRQPFEAVTGVELGEGNALSRGETAAVIGEDFTPLGFSSSEAFSGDLVFVGYGIRSEELDYDDYAGIDVEGKVVLALRYEPGEKDEASPFDGRRATRWSDLRYKAMKAREAGAAALVFVTGPAGLDETEPDKLPPLRRSGPISHAGLPVLQITRATAQEWLSQADLDLGELQSAIDGDYQPHSTAVLGVTVSGQAELELTRVEVRNVLALAPGRGGLAHEHVIVGAHYDHLGMGGSGSMRPDAEEVHNGADDNASGVAAMLCGVGGALRADDGTSPRRSLLIVAFSAEEIGTGGSSYYVDNPIMPLDKTVAMVNLDMVGRVREGKLQALGTDSAPEWEALVLPAAEAAGLTLTTGGDGYGPSDQMPFYEKGVPVVHLFSGAHEEYHTPEDDAETLNAEGGAQVGQMLAALLDDLLTTDTRLTWQKSQSGPLMAGDSRGYGAYLGTIPDYSAMGEMEGGVLLSDVRTDGPADRAGLEGGDRIIGMAGVEVQNLYDMTFVLQDHKPDDTIEVIVLRDGEELHLQATLGRRGKKPEGEGGHDAHDPHGSGDWAPSAGVDAADQHDEREVHLTELRQLTFGGDNAEAYFSPDGRSLIYQRKGPDDGCDQQYLLDLETGESTLVSSGKGRTTCGYYSYPHGERLIYATTEGGSEECPPNPDMSQGYVWPLYDSFELVWQDGVDGAPEPFMASPGYDAEATVCMADGRVVFTSTRSGDLELYVVNADGTGLEQMTDLPGYDGGAFFTPDCTGLVWRASRPEGEALAEYQGLLSRGLVKPSALELFWMDLDSRDVTQLTDNGAANFGPYPFPDNAGVVFSSNAGASPREFDLYAVGREGGELEQITFTSGFDGFPMFSPDGQWLVFASNRANPDGRETNLYIARWVP